MRVNRPCVSFTLGIQLDIIHVEEDDVCSPPQSVSVATSSGCEGSGDLRFMLMKIFEDTTRPHTSQYEAFEFAFVLMVQFLQNPFRKTLMQFYPRSKCLRNMALPERIYCNQFTGSGKVQIQFTKKSFTVIKIDFFEC